MNLKYIVKDNNYLTVKQVLKQEFNISDRLLTKLKKENMIFVNSILVFVNQQIAIGDVIEVCLDFKEDNSNIVPTKMDLNILYEDDSYIVLNKPAGISIHPSILHYSDSLSNGIRYYFDTIELHKKIRPVTRLDKDTSGVTIFAKNEYIQECLISQMKDNIFYKEYIAICEGNFKKSSGTINLPIAREQDSIIKRCVHKNGLPSITEYKVIFSNNTYTTIKCNLVTGRTHQIRVHMSYIGHPLLGDTLYGNSSNLINRQALHCNKVAFYHPITKKFVEYVANIPSDIENLMPKKATL